MKPSSLTLAAFLAVLVVAATACAEPRSNRAGTTTVLPTYLPVLAAVKARFLPVDPEKGYLVEQVKPSVFVITDGIYQSAFVTTGKGVILFDAPPTFAQHIQQAVADVTDEPIVKIVYSHAHLDHIAGTPLLVKSNPALEIIAEQDVADFLKEKNDARRPLPTTTFADATTLTLGTATVELKRGSWHSDEGDLFVYIPKQKVLIAIDAVAAGYVPFMDFDLSSSFHRYLKVFDDILAYDFDVLVAGHLTSLAGRDDVVENKAYALDVYQTVKRIHDTTDQMAVLAAAAEVYTWENKFALFRTLLDRVIGECEAEIQSRWTSKLAGVDVWSASHCRAALIYARWDD